MKHILILIAITLFGLVKTSLFAQGNNFAEDFLERFENSRKYITAVAEMMPEEKYSFKATPESKSFAENLMHLGYALDWHSQSLLGGRKPRDYPTDTTFNVDNKSKKEMIDVIKKTFDQSIKLIKGFDKTHLDDKLDYFGFNRTKRQIFLLLADHVTHHRGQMLVYLRLNGVVPPKYIEFQ